MSGGVDKLCRAILYQIKSSESLDEAIDAVEVIVGEENVALVNDRLAKRNQKKAGAD